MLSISIPRCLQCKRKPRAACAAYSIQRCANAGFYRYPHSDRTYFRIFRYPLPPMHTRTPGWRADNPLWLRVQSEPWTITDPYHIRIKNNAGETKGLLYTFAPWIPHSTSREQLPFQVPVVGAKLLRSPDRKPELADVTRKTSRIKSFNLSDALIYSYRMDLRFPFWIR